MARTQIYLTDEERKALSTLGKLAGKFRRSYGRSHGVQLPDALIAATVVARDLEFITLSRRHYPMLERVTVPYRKGS